jgi:hypothetical protein
MLPPHTLACFPFADLEANCCTGGGEGSWCQRSSDCRGLSSCVAGQCRGTSGCERACHPRPGLNCCAAETLKFGACEEDSDCQGARTCDKGQCVGESGCAMRLPGDKIIYDRECVCTHIGEFCSYANGIPCADGCELWSPSPGTTMCSAILS